MNAMNAGAGTSSFFLLSLFLFQYRFLKKLTSIGQGSSQVRNEDMHLNVTLGKKMYFLLKNPSGVFMDDCYHETRHRDVPFAENRNYEMVLCQKKTDKKCLWFERRDF